MSERPSEIADEYTTAYHKALSRFGGRPEVTGVDVGYRWKDGERTKEICVRIHVREKFPEVALSERELLPKTVEDVPTDILQGIYVPHDRTGWYHEDPLRKERADTIQPGLSIGAKGGTTGTLGLVVTDKGNGKPCLLSSGHVLASARYPSPGGRILQPGPQDGGHESDTVARLTRWNLGQDWGVATLDDARPWDREQYETNVDITGSQWPQIGDELVKSGRTTSVTHGVVDGKGTYMGLRWAIRLVPATAGTDIEISYDGDSGAVWYDPTTGKGVGLHSKGELNQNPDNEVAIAATLPLVALYSNVEIP